MRSPWRGAALCCFGLATACGSGTDFTAPEQTALRGRLLVSDAAPLLDSAGMATRETYTYVSLPAGTLPTGARATVRNRATGETADAPSIDGAVDPVRLLAATGDTVELSADDGQGGASEEVSEVKKRVPPVVVRSEPGGGATDAPTLVRVHIVFSEPVTARSVTRSTVTVLLRDQPVEGTVVLSPEGLF
ncbi:MAG: Ig-like domain-containing protein, partial [Gemmatimonadales bacterium]